MLVTDAEESHVVVPHRHAVRRLDPHSEQPLREGEQAVQHARQREIRPQGFLAEVVFLFAPSLGPEGQVPVAQACRLRRPGRRGAGALVLQVLLPCRQGGLPQFFQKVLDGRHVGRHLAGQAEFGKASVAQQGGHFPPQLQDAADQRGVVQLAAAGAADRGTVELLPVVAPPAVRHEGHERRVVQRDAPGAVFRAGVGMPGLAGGLGGDLQEAGRQALNVLRVLEGQREGLGGVQDVVAEAGAELGQFLLDGVEALSLFALQADAGQFGVAKQYLHDTPLGGVATLPGSAVSQPLQRLENGLALTQPHGELHDGRLHFLVGGAQLLAILHAHQMPDDPPCHAQAVTEAFQGFDQALPGRLRVRFQVLQLSAEVVQHLPDGRPHVLRADAVEGGVVTGLEQRIFVGRLLFVVHLRFL